ncbi:MAG: hypothetical protein H0X51_04790 [Parachlamydiaceae bacterium]|nr:hypothetical protein [Parachlamydiaceae bacterium]
MKKDTRDSLSRWEGVQDMYYVHTPNSSHSARRDAAIFAQEQLEAKLYVKLQGHRGRVLPLIGRICKVFVLAFLIPFYTVKAVSDKIEQLVIRAYQRVVGVVYPPYARVCGFFARRVAAVQAFFNRHFLRIQKRWQAVFQLAVRVRVQLTTPIVTWITFKQEKIKQKYRVLEKHVSRGLSAVSAKLTPEVSVGDRFETFAIKRLLMLQEAVMRPKRKMQSYSHRLQDTLTKGNNIVFGGVRNRYYTLKAWVRVLSRYSKRVLEDWTLEMKQRFSLRS